MPERPNILLITSDQQHWDTLGCVNPKIQTPALDRLAAEGTRFTRAYCPNPTCTPTRASMITGKYPSQHGAWSLGTKLPEWEHCVGDDLQAAGYHTALIGKAHFQPLRGTREFPSLEAYPVLQDLAFWRRFHGPFYGFAQAELARNHTDEAHVGQHYALWLEEQGCTNWREYFLPPTGTRQRRPWHWEIPERYHYNAWIADRTNAWLDTYAREGRNFLLWASFFDPHPDYLVPEPWDTMYDPRQVPCPQVTPGEHDRNPPHFRLTQVAGSDFSAWAETPWGNHGMHSHLVDPEVMARNVAVYYGMVSCLDRYVGRILERLEHLGLAGNTLVVFTTDHGHFYGQHGLTAKGPFMYEDLVRVPFIVRQPGHVPAGRVHDALVSLVDLAPTFLGACGLPIPGGMTGVDQSAVFAGSRAAARDHVVVEHHHQPTAIHLKTYVDRRYKLTVYFRQDYGELFDLQDDPGEIHNLWHEPAAQALKAELVRQLLFAEMGKEPLWMPRIAHA